MPLAGLRDRRAKPIPDGLGRKRLPWSSKPTTNRQLRSENSTRRTRRTGVRLPAPPPGPMVHLSKISGPV